MSEKVIKRKSYENLWGSTRFPITRLSCQPDDVSLLIVSLRKAYSEHGYHIIDSYVVQGDKICTIEFLLKLKKIDDSSNGNLTLTIKEEPQLVTDKVVEEYLSSQMIDLADDFEPEDGAYAIPGKFRTKIRALYDYLIERGISMEELTQDEWKKFIVRKEK